MFTSIQRARRVAAAALASAGAMFAVAGEAQAQDRWQYRETDNGALTRICASNDDRVCAVLFCAVTDDIRFALDGFREGGRLTEAPGTLTIDGDRRDAPFTLRGDGRESARLWVADVGDVDQLLDDLSRGSALTVTFGRRRIDFDFSLRGSSRAIRSLFATCARQRPVREDPEPEIDEPLAFDRWRARERDNGSIAQSCADGPDGRVCAALSCGVDGLVGFEVRGHEFSGGRSAAPGRILVGRVAFQTDWRRAEDFRGRAVRRADVDDIDLLMDRIASGSSLSLRFRGRAERLEVGLRGSRAAVEALRDSCARRARDSIVDDLPPADPEEGGAQEPWRFVRSDRGGAAFACTTGRGGRERCAVLACNGAGSLFFGLDGVAEGGGGGPRRDGAIIVDGDALDTTWRRSEGGFDGDIFWRADVDNTRALARRIARGGSLTVEFGRRSIGFSLEGSGRAVRRVRRECDALVEEEAPPARAACALHTRPNGGGETLLLDAGQSLPELGEFDGRVQSLSVADGCRIAVFSNRRNRGFVVQSRQDVGRLPFLIVNTVSSASCVCD